MTNYYFHIPFCISRCNYCAFYSNACKNPNWNNYTTKILSELEYWRDRIGNQTAETIFFGGGTPSLMPTSMFEQIMANISIAPDAEITIEANPGTLTAEKLAEFVRLGVNRISIGAQSLDEDELKFLGRRHSVRDATDLINAAANLGLRVSADFIYGLPGHNATHIKNLCAEINALPIEHCSMYELSVEPGTPFAKMNLNLPDNDTMAEMYETISETLKHTRYEVSNYGEPCRHNQNVWDGEQYIGIGNGAAGRVIIDNKWYETSSIILHPSSIKSRALEKIITGLRTTRGVKLTDDVREIINWDYIKQNPHLFTVADTIALKNFLLLDTILLNLIK